MQMDIGERRQGEDKCINGILCRGQGYSHIVGYLRDAIFCYQPGKTGLEFFGVGIRAEEEIGVEADIGPGLAPEVLGRGAEESIEMEMGLIGYTVDDAGDLTGAVLLDLEGLAQRGARSKIFFGKILCDDQAVRLDKRGMLVAFEEGQGKDGKEIGIDEDHALFLELAFAVPDETVAEMSQAGEGLDLRIGGGHARSHGDVDHRVDGSSISGERQIDAIDILCSCRIPVIVCLVADIGGDEEGCGES